jgi:hypothetical protein
MTLLPRHARNQDGIALLFVLLLAAALAALALAAVSLSGNARLITVHEEGWRRCAPASTPTGTSSPTAAT